VKSSDKTSCPLCLDENSTLFHEDRSRIYCRCTNCFLIYVPSKFHLSLQEEKSRYDLHRNDSSDPEYRKFLGRLFDPLIERLPQGAKGLDYGSGPGPTLSLMLGEAGFSTEVYDPFFADDINLLRKTYDFLTCTETVEHFHHPDREFELFLKLVRKNGWIGIMTQMIENDSKFPEWHYIRDDTHVCFYSKTTFEWIAKRYDLTAHFIGNSVVLLRV